MNILIIFTTDSFPAFFPQLPPYLRDKKYSFPGTIVYNRNNRRVVFTNQWKVSKIILRLLSARQAGDNAECFYEPIIPAVPLSDCSWLSFRIVT